MDAQARIEQLLCEMREQVVSETREGLAEALRYVAREPALDDDEAPGGPVPLFSDEDSFLAGVTWAAQLVADESFEF